MRFLFYATVGLLTSFYKDGLWLSAWFDVWISRRLKDRTRHHGHNVFIVRSTLNNYSFT
jgi:hypothetical protein